MLLWLAGVAGQSVGFDGTGLQEHSRPHGLQTTQIPPQQQGSKTPDSRLQTLRPPGRSCNLDSFPHRHEEPPPPPMGTTHTEQHSSSTHAHTPDQTRPHHSMDNMTLPQPSGPLTDCISLESSLGLDRSCAWACNQHPSAIKSCHLVDPFSIPRCSNVTSPSFSLYSLHNRIPRYHPASRNTSCRAQVVQGSFFRPGRPSRTLLTM